MWPWVVAIIVALLALAWNARAAWRTSVRQEVRAFLGERRPDMAISRETGDTLHLKLPDGTDLTFNLLNLYFHCSGLKPNTLEARRAVYAKFLDALEEGLAFQNPTLEKHGDRILPRLVQRGFLEEGSDLPPLAHQDLSGTPLVVVYVVDGTHANAYLTRDHVAGLGLSLEALHDRALGNLRARSQGLTFRDALGGSVVVVKTEDTHAATRLLLVPEALGDDERLAVMVPDRDTLVVAPAPQNGGWDALRKVSRSVGAPPLLEEPILVTRGGFHAV
jgi:hypothetical protein